MRKIVFAQSGIAGITHTALVSPDMYDSWMSYAQNRKLIILVDKLI